MALESSENKPFEIKHKAYFKNLTWNQEKVIEWWVFKPKLNEKPIIISSPLKGKKMIFINQSTMAYHFFLIFFMEWKYFRGERFAFDGLKLNNTMTHTFDWDPKKNSSYINYKDPIYAISDWKIVYIKDGIEENDWNSLNHLPHPFDIEKLWWNLIVQDIWSWHYAFYAHCVPWELKVKVWDFVKEWTQIWLVWNSGNSELPHLHFQITDWPDFFFSHWVPFIIKQFTKTWEYEWDYDNPISNDTKLQTFYNSIIEQNTIMEIE